MYVSMCIYINNNSNNNSNSMTILINLIFCNILKSKKKRECVVLNVEEPHIIVKGIIDSNYKHNPTKVKNTNYIFDCLVIIFFISLPPTKVVFVSFFNFHLDLVAFFETKKKYSTVELLLLGLLNVEPSTKILKKD